MNILRESKFTENDIRPEELLKKYWEIRKEDVGFLQSRKNQFIEIDCPACATNDKIHKFSKDQFKYVECPNCGMLYTSPRPTVEILSEFFPNSVGYKFFNDYLFPASSEVRREKMFKPRVAKVLNYCSKYNVTTNKILEIGTGFGFFCEEMAKTGVFNEVVGVETSNSLAETCQSKGFRIYNGLLEELDITEKFDVSVAFEVIEHIFNPEIFLNIIHKILNDNGIIMLTFPQWEGMDISVLKEYSPSVIDGHWNYFTENSIDILLKKVGFELLEVSTPGELDMDMLKKTITLHSLEVPGYLQKICRNDDIAANFQRFLQENKLSSHMMIVAKKM